MATTIKDIAKALGISHSTVSRVLTGSKSVNEKTKEAVLNAVKELNYIPNMSARSLKIDKAYNIGVFFSTISNGTSPFVFQTVINNVYKNIDKKYNVIVKGIDMYEKNTINPKNYDGILVVSQKIDDDDFIKEILEKEIPTVVINRKVDHDVINVYTDESVGVYKGVEELIKNGHKDIAIIEGAMNFDSTKMRRDGYLKAFNNYNIKLNKNLVLNGNFTVKSGYEKANELIEMNEQFSAIFAFNDEMATGAIKAITEHGLKVPEDISILGFDGNEIGRFITPSITTIKRPIGEIARIATDLLLRLLNNEQDITTKKIYIESELELGNSIKDLN
ncbi:MULTISPECIES: LacI family DNA-binding transcriptional regulator [Clostridium]|uniref:LacI family DNA-binding transcriptional regulator n=1 Tax=Candidatus Clostridium helianthi TaxID=3381660 RepID=A0ABW8S211_9CLOT|nr:LacI family DNA-binding transcriptional regulator [Clostridium beijerinckii]MBA8934940.1 LacI family transcriptional regulator [Clostridium beijerinckii]NRU39338.1 LacI family transcriptional regulator [Clostridium beijerinckii]NSA97384.1 LacI family transcriptional regulator [Clostridium beijerinckii]OOM60024.1 putative HTH-type transcriptional repressor ExuR [Clostridium beijerinckii]OOM69746.1 putative HTH-type transcriptional repressor ExuR [Clostridium beijerinckii]